MESTRMLSGRYALGISSAILGCMLVASIWVFQTSTILGCIAIVATACTAIALRSLGNQQREQYENYYATIAALSRMLQGAHPYTHGHLERVANFAEEVALNLGLSPDRARQVREASVLHDIGKIAVDEQILDKPAKLTLEEFEHVKRHSDHGARILEPVAHFRAMVPWIRHHHERLDGTGYPDQLSGGDIPLESRIISVVDAFDAMIGSDEHNGKRPYRVNMTQREALAELDRCSGTQFDAKVVNAFKALVEGEGR